MDHHGENAIRTSPPRPLTEAERHLLLGWIKAAKRFSAFVSERGSDDPAIYRRIVVSRRGTNQHLYLIHCPTNAADWIVNSANEQQPVERFPTLRAALSHIEPVTLSTRVAAPSSVNNDSVTRQAPLHRGTWTTTSLRIVGLGCALIAVLVALRWFRWDNSIADRSRNAESIAELVVQGSVSDADSTQFRNVMAYRVGFDKERWVCGWFNTKNADGALIGYRRFVVHVLLPDWYSPGEGSNAMAHLLLSETEVPRLSYAWETYCH